MRSTMPLSSGATKNVSCIVRAGWSGAMFSASKLNHSASTSGLRRPRNPSRRRRPRSSPGSCSTDAGRQPRRRSQGTVTSTVSSTRIAASRCSCRTTCLASMAWRNAFRADPTRCPASALAEGGSAPISRFAKASGERSPACASRTSRNSSRVLGTCDRGQPRVTRSIDGFRRQRAHLHRVERRVRGGHGLLADRFA